MDTVDIRNDAKQGRVKVDQNRSSGQWDEILKHLVMPSLEQTMQASEQSQNSQVALSVL